MPSRVLVCLPRIFSLTMSLSASIGGARRPLAEEIEACICEDRQAKWTQNLTVVIFVDHEILFYFVQRVNISKLIFMYLQQELSPG